MSSNSYAYKMAKSAKQKAAEAKKDQISKLLSDDADIFNKADNDKYGTDDPPKASAKMGASTIWN